MHTFTETGTTGVPAFLAKLWRLVDDPKTNHLICWSKDGRSFIIQNQAQFARELLPLNYKHNNMASFIRQLNMYGFHKITSIDNGGLKFDRDEMEFCHPCFKKNNAVLLEHIKRKIANTKTVDDKSPMKQEAVSKVLQDVKAMRGRQDSLDSRFSVMKQENEALWREIASLRQKHAKQQQIVNKLIQFLITIVQPSRNMTSVKRHMQLMIHDTPENAKLRNNSESESDCGPVIHELGEELLDEVNEVDPELINANSPYSNAGLPVGGGAGGVESPLPMMASQQYDFSNLSADDVNGIGSSAGNSSSSGSGGNGNTMIGSAKDGSQVIYHVTEMPDAQPNDNMPSFASTPVGSGNYNEDNVLHTPLVRQELERSQLKERNKLRRQQADNMADLNTPNTNSPTPFASKRLLSATNQQASSGITPTSDMVQVKVEKPEIDPMLFLNTYAGASGSNLGQQESLQANDNVTKLFSEISGVEPSTSNDVPPLLDDTNSNMYNSNDFITDDIFDNALLIGDDNTLQQESKSSQLSQNQINQTTDLNRKFSPFINGSNTIKAQSDGNSRAVNNNVDILPNGPSTSAAAGVNSGSMATSAQTLRSGSEKNNNNNNKETDSNDGITTLAKYKLAKPIDDHATVRDEVHGHLDSVQDELETLKDLLRGDGYSLDASVLMGYGTKEQYENPMFLANGLDGELLHKLFNDSDILGPYGLQYPADESNQNKKGSELAAGQPLYDLSEMMDINNERPALMQSNEASNRSGASQGGAPSSLNTPQHQ